MGQAIAEGLADWLHGAEQQAQVLADMRAKIVAYLLDWGHGWEGKTGLYISSLRRNEQQYEPFDNPEWVLSLGKEDWEILVMWNKYAAKWIHVYEQYWFTSHALDEDWEEMVEGHRKAQADWDATLEAK